jgi:hypothetical protein
LATDKFEAFETAALVFDGCTRTNVGTILCNK